MLITGRKVLSKTPENKVISICISMIVTVQNITYRANMINMPKILNKHIYPHFKPFKVFVS